MVLELNVGVAPPSEVNSSSYWTYWLLFGAQELVIALPEFIGLQLVKAGASDKFD